MERRRLKEGIISIYVPIPSLPNNLVETIFIIMPKTFVTSPPNNKIIVDLINLFFILKYMKIKKDYSLIVLYINNLSSVLVKATYFSVSLKFSSITITFENSNPFAILTLYTS